MKDFAKLWMFFLAMALGAMGIIAAAVFVFLVVGDSIGPHWAALIFIIAAIVGITGLAAWDYAKERDR